MTDLDMRPAEGSPSVELLRLGLTWNRGDDKSATWADYPDGITCTVPTDGDTVTFLDMDTRETREVPKSGLKDITSIITWRTAQKKEA